MVSFPSGFLTNTLYTPLSSPIRATYSTHLILLDFITRTILDEELSHECYLFSFLTSMNQVASVTERRATEQRILRNCNALTQVNKIVIPISHILQVLSYLYVGVRNRVLT